MSEKKKYNYAKELTKGFLKENPVLRLVLGTCPTLATSTSVINGIGMGLAATIVLICSNVAISALRKVIPAKARIPAYIVIIASFVTMVQMLVKAFVPALDASLGVFLPLIVVNCIILGRAEAYASKNPVLVSAIDGLGMGIGFTAALFAMGAVREILGGGTFLSGIDTMLGAYIDLGSFTGFDFTDELASIGLAPMTIFILPAGGFFVFGILMALANKLAERKGLPVASLGGCKGCPHASFCAKAAGEAGGEAKCSLPSEKEAATKKAAVVKKTEEVKKEDASPVTADKKPEIREEAPKKAESVQEEVITEKEKTAENAAAATADTKAEAEPQSEVIQAEEAQAEEAQIEEAQAEEVQTEEVQAEEVQAEEVQTEAEEEIQDEAEDVSFVDEPSEEAAPVKTRKQFGKKNRSSKKDIPSADFSQPLPDIIPEFLRKDIEKNKAKEEKGE